LVNSKCIESLNLSLKIIPENQSKKNEIPVKYFSAGSMAFG